MNPGRSKRHANHGASVLLEKVIEWESGDLLYSRGQEELNRVLKIYKILWYVNIMKSMWVMSASVGNRIPTFRRLSVPQ